MLFQRYLGAYVEIDRIYLSSVGYQILIRLKGIKRLKDMYISKCKRRKKAIKEDYINEP